MELEEADLEVWRAMRPRELSRLRKPNLLDLLIWFINETAEPKEARKLRGDARRLLKAELADLVIEIVERFRGEVLGGRPAAIAHTRKKQGERAEGESQP